jgi:hypothetical protein
LFAPGLAGFRPPRPLGITILVILQIIIGVIEVLFGLLLLLGYVLAVSIFGFGMYPGFGLFLLPWGFFSLIFGLLSFILAYGLWTGQGWAWISSVIIAVIGLIFSLVGLILGSYANVISLVLYALILIYLNTYHVRAFFGRVGPWGAVPYPGYPPPPPPQPQYTQPPLAQPPPVQSPYYTYPQQPVQSPYTPPPQQPMSQGLFFSRTTMCPKCLSPLAFGAASCPRCGAQFR